MNAECEGAGLVLKANRSAIPLYLKLLTRSTSEGWYAPGIGSRFWKGVSVSIHDQLQVAQQCECFSHRGVNSMKAINHRHSSTWKVSSGAI